MPSTEDTHAPPDPLAGWTLITGSAGKAREVAEILGGELAHRPLDLPEVQAVRLEDVVGAKAEAAYARLGAPVIVEDTGLFFAAWNGLPGALVKWFVDTVGVEGICRMLTPFDDRRAVARTVVAAHDGRLRTYAGEVSGRIAGAPAGSGGFGWDPIFIPDGQARTFAEMAQAEKLRFSMRRIAFEAMAADLGRPSPRVS
ncbi:MAG TPA: non-canonical purine NTP pyrophosphatase [Longimicrobium sp.]|jgi:non-canonical purine NTP pyrophosphatase (RdgB/HAM1 family)